MARDHHSWEWLIGWNLFCRLPNFLRSLVGRPHKTFRFPRWYNWLWSGWHNCKHGLRRLRQ
jgi:hypothetical protein